MAFARYYCLTRWTLLVFLLIQLKRVSGQGVRTNRDTLVTRAPSPFGAPSPFSGTDNVSVQLYLRNSTAVVIVFADRSETYVRQGHPQATVSFILD